MSLISKSFAIPFRVPLIFQGIISDAWMHFFRSIYDRLMPLGFEQYFELENNKSTATDITGLKFDSRGQSQAIIECFIQRVTTGTGAVEYVEAPVFAVAYYPTSDKWKMESILVDKPDDSGVTLSITDAGQVQYTSTDVAGTASISRIVYRVRVLAGKHSSYSDVGVR